MSCKTQNLSSNAILPDLTGPRPLAVEADKFEKDGKPYQLTRKQRRDYQSTGKLPEGVTKVE